MDLFDVEAAEKAEAQIDAFISKRNQEREEANRIEAAWAETTRRYNQKRQLELREEWREYYLDQAERLERTAAELAADHRSKAAALAGED